MASSSYFSSVLLWSGIFLGTVCVSGFRICFCKVKCLKNSDMLRFSGFNSKFKICDTDFLSNFQESHVVTELPFLYETIWFALLKVLWKLLYPITTYMLFWGKFRKNQEKSNPRKRVLRKKLPRNEKLFSWCEMKARGEKFKFLTRNNHSTSSSRKQGINGRVEEPFSWSRGDKMAIA